MNLGSLLLKLSDFEVSNIDLVENVLTLAIKLFSRVNIKEIEETIKSRFPEYSVQITFLVEENKSQEFKKIIGISSGKGGVGKSMTALNLAFALRDNGRKVGIIDADAYSPSIAGLLGLKEAPVSKDGRLIEPVKTHGLEVLSMGLFLKDGESQVWQDGTISAVFTQFLLQANWQCEYLIVDFAGGMSDVYQACLKVCPNIEILMITQPNKMVYRDAIRMFTLVRAMGLKIIGFVENMSDSFYSDEKLKEFEVDLFHIRRVAFLPFFKSYKKYIEHVYPENYRLEEEAESFNSLIKKII